MKKLNLIMLCGLLFATGFSQKTEWQIVPGRIKTVWADSVNPMNVLPDYPRPQMVRDNWQNLNGLWQYSISPDITNENIPASFDGNILVPFAVESALSGVGKSVGKDSILWYQKSFTVSKNRKNKRILLHFGAVDWRSDIFINGKKIGTHEGGYDPFTFDITDALNDGEKQTVAVRVWDPGDAGPQPRGKQVNHPEGIWYTSVTGIWQTVWLETVSQTYIDFFTEVPDVVNKELHLNVTVKNRKPDDDVVVTAWNGNIKVASNKTDEDTYTYIPLSIPEPELWSPDHPFLYALDITVMRKGKKIDEVKSYFAMRDISIAPDEKGIKKIMLNKKFLFEYGPLDQGWWPDGLYTAPTDAAMKNDIETLKQMGCNMIRKHVKVEPARWYYYCDKLGMMVWQDMPSGDLGNGWNSNPGIFEDEEDKKRTRESEGYYRKEWNAIIDALYNFPSIVVWIPFNEGWGQFKTDDITKWTKQKDISRLVNSASGGNFYNTGDILDIHNYPDPAMPKPELFGSKQALVLGEFGGLGFPVNNHTWEQKNWGYQNFKNEDELSKKYELMIDKLSEFIAKGLSAAIYTQTTDVETEVNGFMTYDRKVIKIPLEKLKALNQKLFNTASNNK